MKKTQKYIFVDDGYPEAEEYDTNYISWDERTPGSYQKALAEAKNMLNGNA